MIPKETIDRIYNTARIEEVIGDYVTLRRRGANLIGLCPFHEEKTGSFTVSPAKGIYKCFGCGKAGNVVNFIMEYEQCTYVEALHRLAERYHIEIQERELTPEEKQRQDERESLFAVNEWANKWFQNNLFNTEEGRTIGLKYFLERGLREDIVRKFQLGYSPDTNALYAAAKRAGYTDEYLEKTGLCGRSEKGSYYDRFRGRVMFPIFTVSGKVVAFAGRILKAKEHVGKYVNSPESSIYSKQNELYGLSLAKQAIAKAGFCYLVEGQMDVISMHQAGVENVVSSGGTALTRHQILLLHRFTENVVILYDGDAAGIHAALRGIDMLLEAGLNIKVVLLPNGEDPDSFARSQNASDFIEFLKSHSQDFIQFKTHLLLTDAASDPIKKSEVVRSILQSIAVIPQEITRQIYLQTCSGLLNMPENILLRELKQIRKQQASAPTAYRPSASASTTSASTAQPATTTDPASAPATATNSAPVAPATETKKTHLQQNMLNLLQVLIRYGERPLFTAEDGTIWTVGDYILTDLQTNGIAFTNALYQQVLEEYAAHCKEPGFVAEQFFKYHPDPQMSSLAIRLISDPYLLSKIHNRVAISENVQVQTEPNSEADDLTDLVPRLLNEIKLTLVNEQIAAIQQQIKTAQAQQQEQALLSLLKDQSFLEQTKRDLCKALGQSVVV